MSSQLQSDRAAVEALLVLPADEIDAARWEPVPGCPGVIEKTLWRFGAFTQALVHYDTGASSPGRPHARRRVVPACAAAGHAPHQGRRAGRLHGSPDAPAARSAGG